MLATRRIEVIVVQLGKLDLTSAAGKLMLAAVAEMERALIMERTQSGLVRAKAEGRRSAVRLLRRRSSGLPSSSDTRLGSRSEL
jgi:DNA invertase Pin-like site-specific DNA recombinase